MKGGEFRSVGGSGRRVTMYCRWDEDEYRGVMVWLRPSFAASFVAGREAGSYRALTLGSG